MAGSSPQRFSPTPPSRSIRWQDLGASHEEQPTTVNASPDAVGGEDRGRRSRVSNSNRANPSTAVAAHPAAQEARHVEVDDALLATMRSTTQVLDGASSVDTSDTALFVRTQRQAAVAELRETLARVVDNGSQAATQRSAPHVLPLKHANAMPAPSLRSPRLKFLRLRTPASLRTDSKAGGGAPAQAKVRCMSVCGDGGGAPVPLVPLYLTLGDHFAMVARCTLCFTPALQPHPVANRLRRHWIDSSVPFAAQRSHTASDVASCGHTLDGG